MAKKYGLIPIKVRSKAPIDMGDFSFDDFVIDGKIANAKGGKLVVLDLYIETTDDEDISYYGVVPLAEDKEIIVIGWYSLNPAPIKIILTDDDIQFIS